MMVWDTDARRTASVALGVLLAVAVLFVWVLNRPTWEDQPIIAVAGATDSASIRVTVMHGACGNGGPRVHVDQRSADAVGLRADYDIHGDCDAIAMQSTVEVELDHPLGDRVLRIEHADLSLKCLIDGAAEDACS